MLSRLTPCGPCGPASSHVTRTRPMLFRIPQCNTNSPHVIAMAPCFPDSSLLIQIQLMLYLLTSCNPDHVFILFVEHTWAHFFNNPFPPLTDFHSRHFMSFYIWHFFLTLHLTFLFWHFSDFTFDIFNGLGPIQRSWCDWYIPGKWPMWSPIRPRTVY